MDLYHFLIAMHIPRVSSVLADRLSRTILLPHEWSLNPVVVNTIFSHCGVPLCNVYFPVQHQMQLVLYPYSLSQEKYQGGIRAHLASRTTLYFPTLTTDVEIYSEGMSIQG